MIRQRLGRLPIEGDFRVRSTTFAVLRVLWLLLLLEQDALEAECTDPEALSALGNCLLEVAQEVRPAGRDEEGDVAVEAVLAAAVAAGGGCQSSRAEASFGDEHG